MIIEIKGVQFVNKGAELMLHAIVQQVEKRWPDARVALEPNANSPYGDRARLGALQKLSLRKNRLDLNAAAHWLPEGLRNRWRRHWGIVTAADIDVVLDASGFAYGDAWPALKIRHLAGELQCAHRHGKAYVFLPQAFGPFTRPADRALLAKSLPLARLICAREHSSLEHLEGLIGKAPNLMRYPDFTNLVQGVVPAYFTGGASRVLIIPNSNMVSPRNAQSTWRSQYVRVLMDAIAAVRHNGLIPVLLNHEGRGDGRLCDTVREQAAGEVELLMEADPLKVKGIIGASAAVICSRFHGCVSALSQGVPCLGTSWSHKYERLFEEYHRSPYLLSPDMDRAAIGRALESCMDTADDDNYQQAMTTLKAQSEALWNEVSRRLAP